MARDLRKDFEIACLFRGDLTNGKAGFLRKKQDGTYEEPKAESLFLGYVMGREGDEAQLQRYNPNRFIGTGHMTELRENLTEAGHAMVTEGQVRCILRVVKGWPK